MRKKSDKFILDILARYFLVLVLGLGNFYILYKILSPLTIYPVYYFLKIFFNVTLLGSTIIYQNFFIDIIGPCIAVGAYFLLFALNLTTPMPLKTRINALLFSFFTLLVINLVRIIFLSFLIIKQKPYFDITHEVLWYGLSTIFVVGIWFSQVKVFNIKSIPIYSDIKNIKDSIK